jgi:hypothetical protein
MHPPATLRLGAKVVRKQTSILPANPNGDLIDARRVVVAIRRPAK